MGADKNHEYCVGCGENVINNTKKRYVFREFRFLPICVKCADGRRYAESPKYNQRPLGYPKVQGGKQAPGRYEWSD